MSRLPNSRSTSKRDQSPSVFSPLAEKALATFIAVDPKSLRLIESAKKIAAAASTVLIQGESGAGKDLLASLLHYLGPSPEQPLVKIDCGNLPHELLESELFGFEQGAFTGATQMKRGRLELAEHGTLVLDEIASLSMAMQAKLLRVIEDRSFDRLGGTKPVKVHARVIALTNIDLADAVARRGFREDLYYRLNVVPMRALPLRERPLDIPPLAERLLVQLVEFHRRDPVRMSADALTALRSYPFPGNVRELRNILERTIVHLSLSTSTITLDDLPANVRTKSSQADSIRSLAEMERDHIAEVLDHTRGKKTKAAEILGISRKNLLEKRKKYGV